MRKTLSVIAALLVISLAHGAVDISLGSRQETRTGNETRIIQPVTLSNEVASFTLNYDYTINADKPGEATSNWWGWQTGFIPIGMTQPSNPNWYWQAFFNWRFDEESLANRPATVRVVRPGGDDGLVEYSWDTPVVKASVFFGLASGSDKLLMFGQYEPKTDFKRSWLTFSVYPATFEQPRNRAVTTALGTRTAGQRINVDLAKERWLLFEDVTPNRPGAGSAGMIIGTPDSFSKIDVPVAEYGITPALDLKPEARSFALALYDFPSMPDFQQTRDYFSRSADAEADAIGKMAAAGMAQVLPAMPIEPQRLAGIRAGQTKYFERAVERWQPTGSSFPWASKLPGGPIRVKLYVPRWRAWETMALAGAMPLQVEHLYFDGSGALTNHDYWPYAGTTGQGAIPYGVAMQKAVAMAQDPQADVFVVATVAAGAIPSIARQEIAKQVAAGKGLLLIATGTQEWPQEMFRQKNAALASSVLADLAWQQVPGFREGDRGRAGELAQAYDYGQGRVVVLSLRPTSYGAVVPAHDETDAYNQALEHALPVAARALQAAAGRPSPVRVQVEPAANGAVRLHCEPLPAGASAWVQVVDDLDHVYPQETLLPNTPLKLTAADTTLQLKGLPANRAHFVDVRVTDGQMQTVGFAFAHLPAQAEGADIRNIALSPRTAQPAETLTPMLTLTEGGTLTATAEVAAPPAGATLTGQVRDAFDRIVWQTTVPVRAAGPVTLTGRLLRPVTPCHRLDLALTSAAGPAAIARQHFAVAMPYPYDDYTGLMWSYAGGDPVLRRSDRLCYEWGADMMDLCHVGGFAEAKAAREYLLSSQSGLRIIPYVTRIAGDANEQNERIPCLHDPAYLEGTNTKLRASCAQAQPFSPAAYTLGDENYLFRGRWEVCHRPESVAEFQRWLQAKYGDIAKLNAAWGLPTADTPAYTGFDRIIKPMILSEAARQETSFAPWIDHKRFMSEAFANTHDVFRETIRTVDPQAKVGYDGFLGFNWQSGYDFDRLAENLELNQTYTVNWIQGELATAFRRPGALIGKWGNSDADNEAGWHAFPWHGLLSDDNSVWWWTSWGCDYIPFNPDLSQSDFGKWFFEALRDTTQGPGKLLLDAERELSPVAVLHSQEDFHLTDVLYEMGLRTPFAAGGQYLNEETAMLHGIRDAGRQYRIISPRMLTAEGLRGLKALFLPFASCLSDAQVAVLSDWVRQGGTLVADGRIGMLTAEGRIRDSRPLDGLFGVKSEAGLAAVKRDVASGEVAVDGSLAGAAAAVPLKLDKFSVSALEPGVRTTTGKALVAVGETPVLIVNAVGTGRAMLLNMPLTEINSERSKPGLHPKEAIVQAILASAGVPQLATITAAEGSPMCLDTVTYRDGNLRYVAIMQDFRLRGLPEQKLTLATPEGGFVYDLRAGNALGQPKQVEFSIGRGYPQVYAILPYRVTAVKPATAGSITTGSELPVKVTVQATKPAEDHVVRLDVYPPKSTTPHRQYSQNITCPKGQGAAIIPFAANDARGQWRLVWRDVATGVTATSNVEVK